MNKLAIGLLVCGISACATDGGPQIGVEERAALGKLGVAQVERDNDRFVLADADNRAIGEVLISSGYLRASLHGTTFESKIGDHTTATCNGSSVTLGAGDPSVLAACDDVERVTSILLGAPLHEAAPTGANLAPACHSAYLDGCISWNQEQGCTTMQYCYVYWCSNGFNDWQCSIE